MTAKKAPKNLFAEFQKTGWDPFITYRVRLLLQDIVGGIPKNKELIEAWVNARNKKKTAEARQELVDATKAKLAEIQGEQEEARGIGFLADEKGLYIEGRQLKAMLKEASNITKKIVPGGKKTEKNADKKTVTVSAEGISALKSKVAERMFVEEDRIYLGVMKPTRIGERPISVETKQGPRSSIKRFEVVENVTIEFTVKRCRDNVVPQNTMLAVMQYAQESALGAERSQGFGKFTVLEVVCTDDE